MALFYCLNRLIGVSEQRLDRLIFCFSVVILADQSNLLSNTKLHLMSYTSTRESYINIKTHCKRPLLNKKNHSFSQSCRIVFFITFIYILQSLHGFVVAYNNNNNKSVPKLDFTHSLTFLVVLGHVVVGVWYGTVTDTVRKKFLHNFELFGLKPD